MDNSNPGAPKPDFLQLIVLKIRALVDALRNEDPNDDGYYRKICQLAQNRLDPEHLRVVLLQAGVHRVRASELVTILSDEKACRAYCEENKARRYALKLARDAKPDEQSKSAANFLRLLLWHGNQWKPGEGVGAWVLQKGTRGMLRFTSEMGEIDVLKRILPR